MLTYYSSDYEIGSTFQVMEQMEKIMVMVESMEMIKVLGLGKEEREKQNGLKAKVILIGPFVLVIKTPSGCDHI